MRPNVLRVLGVVVAGALLNCGCFPMYVNSFPTARSLGSGSYGGSALLSYASDPSSGPGDSGTGTSPQTWDFSALQPELGLRRGLPAGLEIGLDSTLFSMAALDEKYQFLGMDDPSALALAVDFEEQNQLLGPDSAASFALVGQKQLFSRIFLDFGLRPGYFRNANDNGQYPDTYSELSFGFDDPSYPVEPSGWFGDWMVGISIPADANFEFRFQLIERLMLPDRRSYPYYSQDQTYSDPPYVPTTPPNPAGYAFSYAPVWTFVAGFAWGGGFCPFCMGPAKTPGPAGAPASQQIPGP